MGMLTKEAILGAVDLETKDVDVPEWGGTVRVAMMSGKARDEFFGRQGEDKVPYSQFAARVLVATIVGDDGKPLFDAADVDALRAKSQTAMDKVLAVSLKLNGIGGDAGEEAAKNSDAAPSGDSGSALPLHSESL